MRDCQIMKFGLIGKNTFDQYLAINLPDPQTLHKSWIYPEERHKQPGKTQIEEM